MYELINESRVVCLLKFRLNYNVSQRKKGIIRVILMKSFMERKT